MAKQAWIEHLSSWKSFLLERLANIEDKGERVKIERQLRTIERVRCGAVLKPTLLKEFIEPSAAKANIIACNDFSLELNDSQQNAVRTALSDNVLTLIQGPPGTGKTQVITEICLQLFRQNPGIRILVCSETHVAVNNLIHRIAKQNDQIRIVRIQDKDNDDSIDDFSPETLLNEYFSWASKGIQNKDALSIIAEEMADSSDISFEKALALSANITGMTCNRVAAYDFKDISEMYDVAIIDEVCKATLPEILAPLLISKKAILLGDPKQLPPVFCSEEQEVIRSIENCNLNKYMYIDELFSRNNNTAVLNTQYRMTKQIGDMISQVFYGGMLTNGRNKEIEHGLIWIDYSPSRHWPIDENGRSGKREIFNIEECHIVKMLLEKLYSENEKLEVAIITPYKAQAKRLRETCSLNKNVKIDTVDGFQGKEADIVIFSMTRTTGSYRFLADERRLNVALSRAKDQIFIVGNKEYCEKSVLLQSIMERCEIKIV